MTDTTTRLPDLIVRTTSCGDRFGWRLVTLEDQRFLTSMEQSEKDGSPADYATRDEARRAAGQVLIGLVLMQNAESSDGEVVAMSSRDTPVTGRLAA